MSWEDDFTDEIGTYSAVYVPAHVCDAMRGSHQLAVFFRLDVEPDPLRVWLGFNDIPAVIESKDEAGTVYLGGGRLNGIPSLEILINGQADDVEISLTGIDPAAGQRVIDQMPDVRGKAVHIGITTLDDYYQPMSSIIPIWEGVASHPSEAVPPVMGLEPRSMNLSLAVVSGNGTRSRASQATWSAAQHEVVHPGDKFCRNTTKYSRGYTPVFPNW